MTNPVYTSTRFQPTDINGTPLAGAVLEFFDAETSTPITVYADAAGMTPLGSSVTADGSGTFQPIYVPAGNVKTQLFDVDGVLQANGTIDDITLGFGNGSQIILKSSANPAPTVEGDIQWDTDDNRIAIGNGGGTSTFSNDAFNAATYYGSANVATTAQFMSGTAASKVVGLTQMWAAGTEIVLTDAATIAVDLSLMINANVTLAGNRTLGNPSNAKPGQSGRIRIVQDATGSRTLAYSANWKFVGGVVPVLTTTANATDVLYYDVITASLIVGSLAKGIA